MRVSRVFWLLPAISLFSAAVAAKVDVEHNAAIDFSRYATYAWHEGTPARHQQAELRIREGVAQGLAAGGLLRTTESPDLYVATHVLVDKHTAGDLHDPEYFKFYSGVGSVDAYDLGGGTLVVDLVDSRLDKVVWRGIATETVKGKPESNLKKIEKAIRKMFKSYPPPTR